MASRWTVICISRTQQTWPYSDRHSDLASLRIAPPNAYRSAITQPKQEWIVGVLKDDDELLRAMHEKTRYNIRLANKKGVRVSFLNGQEIHDRFDDFFLMLQETANRGHFFLHPKNHYQQLTRVFAGKMEIVIAKFQGRLLAVGLILFFGNTATYLHGGSWTQYRNMMAPFAMHWEAMKRARSKQCRWYSFGGIDDRNLRGVTRFKQGFGGQAIQFGPPHDLVIHPFWYTAYNIMRNVRNK